MTPQPLLHVAERVGVERILSQVSELPPMSEHENVDSEALSLEATRYLAAVDAFRIENCEPMWRPEPVSIQAAESRPSSLDTSSLAFGKHLH